MTLKDTSVTLLLSAYNSGDKEALNQLSTLLYPELKAMARRRAGGSAGLGATTLVQETFLKFLSSGGVRPDDRQQFFGLAATIMRRVIVDEIRYVVAKKRDGIPAATPTDELTDPATVQAEFLVQVDEALAKLESTNALLARVFECRYFGGYTTAEVAEILDISDRSVERHWASAREFMAEQLKAER